MFIGAPQMTFQQYLSTIRVFRCPHVISEHHLCPFFDVVFPFPFLSFVLAHLSRRLTRWAYSIPMVRRPSVVRRLSSSVVVRRRRPYFQTWISLKPVGQSWLNFMCSIVGMGERLHYVLGQIGSKLWFPWQQKAPIDLLRGKRCLHLSRLFLIRSFLYLQVTRTFIKSRTSSNFGQIEPLTTELATLERLKNFP